MPIPAPKFSRPVSQSGRAIAALETTRMALRRFRRAMTLNDAILVSLVISSAVIAADIYWVLPTWVRGVGLGILLVSLVGVAIRYWLAPERTFGKGDAATEVESAFPELGQGLRTSLEYSEPTPKTAPANPGLVRALFVQTDHQAEGLDFPAVVPWSAWRRYGAILSLLVLVFGAFGLNDARVGIAARRLLLLPVHYSTLAVEPGDQTVKEGGEFRLKASLSGRPVASAAWLSRPVGSREAWSVASLAHAEASRPLIGVLEASRQDCRGDFEYKVVAGELESGVYRVTVTHPLTVKTFEASIEPPSYTKLKPSVAKEVDFGVPEGSKVRFRIGLDRAPTSAKLSWTAKGSNEPTIASLAIDGTTLSGELQALASDVRYEVIAVASDRMALEPAKHLIRVKPDAKPTIQFVKPAESVAVIPTTEVPVKVVAADDFGVTKVGVSYRVGEGREESLYLDEPGAQPPSVEALATLYLEKHPLTFADSLSYRGFVEDNRESGHQRVQTELRFIDILPFKQEFEIVLGGGSCSGTSVTLEELIQRQRRTLNRTLAHEADQPAEAKVADRLAKEQDEIARATREFATALAETVGFVPALDAAVISMDRAVTSLSSREFATAIDPEQSALTSLTKARMNLRKLLKDSSSASACRKIDRQQQDQKIRKPPAEKSKEAELAKLEQDIKKLAETEKKFADDIEPKTGGGARLDQPNEPKPGQPSPSKPGSSSPGERQQAAVKEAERLKALARDDPDLSDLAQERMEEAVAQVKQADQANRADQPADAANSARDAADQLQRLADQVGALKAKELADKLAKARDLARQAAKAERELASKAGTANAQKDQLVRDQRGLAEDAKTLSELVKRIEADAAEEDRTLASALAKAEAANSPAATEEAMRQASVSIASGDARKSAQEMAVAASQLEALARDLDAARRDFTQPKLQQLLAAERQAAEVARALQNVASESRKLEAEKGLADLASEVKGLKSGEGPLKDAAESLANLVQSGASTSWSSPDRSPLRRGLFTPPMGYTEAVRGLSKALQARIQELMLIDALVDRDGPVPPGYQEKVAEYFRLLSEDLR